MAELDRGGHSELGEPADVLRGEELGVLDALPEAEWRPRLARLLERVERLAVGQIADRVHRHRPARRRSPSHDLCELVPARDLHP